MLLPRWCSAWMHEAKDTQTEPLESTNQSKSILILIVSVRHLDTAVRKAISLGYMWTYCPVDLTWTFQDLSISKRHEQSYFHYPRCHRPGSTTIRVYHEMMGLAGRISPQARAHCMEQMESSFELATAQLGSCTTETTSWPFHGSLESCRDLGDRALQRSQGLYLWVRSGVSLNRLEQY